MSRVEKMKKRTKAFLEEQYRQHTPKSVKGMASKLSRRGSGLKMSFKERSARGKALLKNEISRRFPVSMPKFRKKKKK